MRNIFLGILFLSMLNSHGQVKTQLKVLFVGNSYTYYNNLPQLVSYMADSTAIKLVTTKSTLGNATLADHWHQRKGLKSKTLIQNGKYDVVVIQENSMIGINQADSLMKYAKLFSDFIKSTGAKPYLYQVWARQRVPQYHQDIEKAYERVVREANISLIPVGRAWNLARNYRPSINLFDPDATHPSAMGTFLSAAVITGAICGYLPETMYQVPSVKDSKGETLELMRLEYLDMVFLMKVARETLKMKEKKEMN